MADPSFLTPGGQDPAQHFLYFAEGLTNPLEGDLLAAGNYLRGEVRDRTYRGESLRGDRFANYSPAYAKKKNQTNVDLRSRGSGKHMLDALMVRIPPDRRAIELGIFGDSDMATRAKVHNEGARVRTRQGRGKKLITKGSFAGLGFARQKKGGKPYADIPQREWLGAREVNLQIMARIIVEAARSRNQR
jgi:hypothetical protein